jgi:deoxyadenosine/deoxycytidine kinase
MFQQIPVPDLTIYIYQSIDRLKSNILRRGRNYEINIKDSYLEQLNENYLAYFKQLTQHRIVIIDGGEYDIVRHPEKKQKLIELISQDYPLGITYI